MPTARLFQMQIKGQYCWLEGPSKARYYHQTEMSLILSETIIESHKTTFDVLRARLSAAKPLMTEVRDRAVHHGATVYHSQCFHSRWMCRATEGIYYPRTHIQDEITKGGASVSTQSLPRSTRETKILSHRASVDPPIANY